MYSENFSSFETEASGTETNEKKHEEQSDENLDNVKEPIKWEIPDLKSLSKEDFICEEEVLNTFGIKKGQLEVKEHPKKIELIVHPLYKFMFELTRKDVPVNNEVKDLIDSMPSNSTFEEIILNYINNVLCKKANNRNYLGVIMSNEFINLMEIIEEISDYRRTCEDNTIRCFLMPKISDLSENQIQLMNKFLVQYGGKNTYVLNSCHDHDGYINYEDRGFLIKNLTYVSKKTGLPTNIEIQGGYIGGCLDKALASLDDMKKVSDVPVYLNIDITPSTGARVRRLDVNITNKNKIVDNFSIKNKQQEKLPISFGSLDEAISWVKKSSTYKNYKSSNCEAELRKYYKDKRRVDSILDNMDK